MQTQFIFHRRAFAAALGLAAGFCQCALAADPPVNADAYVPWSSTSSRRMVVTQIVPAAYNAAQVQGAQPGQSTVPSPGSTTQPPLPPQGAQPGQSTVPSPGSTPPGTVPGPAAPGDAQLAPPTGVAPPFRQPSTIVIPGVQPTPQVVAPNSQVILPPQQDFVPPAEIPAPQVDSRPMLSPTPLLDDADDLPVLEEQDGKFVERRGVRPYGGGHPTDWSWGCNGSPYRTGPGLCDDWRVGCRWHVTIDGMGLSREDADLAAIQAAMPDSFAPLSDADQGLVGDPFLEQFDFDPGARISFMSQVPHVGYQVQAVYEGIAEWNSSIVYEKQPLDITLANPPVPPNPVPFPEGTLQRRLHYRSNYHSGELNFGPGCNRTLMPLFGVRYIQFDDEINDFIDQQHQPPLAGPNVNNLAIGPVTTTDRLNLFDVENQLMGFQLGLLHDTWRLNRRLSLEGVVNAGVYYNRIKYTNYMGIFTTQEYADNTSTVEVDESRIDFSDTINNDVRELSEISYHGEASLTGVCRLNKCWALRGGYQALWLSNLHLAEDGYLDGETGARDLFFHGWHAGIECRR